MLKIPAFLLTAALVLTLSGCETPVETVRPITEESVSSPETPTERPAPTLTPAPTPPEIPPSFPPGTDGTDNSDDMDDSPEPPAYTKEDYDAMRQSLPYKPFEIDYDAPYARNSYLELDETAGILETYLGFALIGIGFLESFEIPDVLRDHDLIFQSASFCTRGFDNNSHPVLSTLPPAFTLTPKEHIDLTAKYLFGDECVVDYHDLAEGTYEYREEYGLAYRQFVVKEGFSPTVLDYEEYDDYFLARIVFLYHSMMSPFDTMSSFFGYYDMAADNDYDFSAYYDFSALPAKEFCYGDIPDKYSVRVDKGENGKLYLRSVLRV